MMLLVFVSPACWKMSIQMMHSNAVSYLPPHAMTEPVSPQGDEDVVVKSADPELAQPPLYKVVLHNDDYTPMEFVVEILQEFFLLDQERAVQVMLAVHTQGKGTCGIFTRDIAETKSHQVNEYARECEHPLMSDIEPADE